MLGRWYNGGIITKIKIMLKHTPEAKKKISEALRKQWADGKKKSPMKGRKHSEETKKKMCENNGKFWLGKHLSKNHKKNVGDGNRGKEISIEHRKKLSKALEGEKSYLWKGGITKENDRARRELEIRLWKRVVLERDNFTCQKCGSQKSGIFNIHHIRNFAEYPKLRFKTDNGITLSEKAHKEFHKKYGTRNNTEEQLKKFISKN